MKIFNLLNGSITMLARLTKRTILGITATAFVGLVYVPAQAVKLTDGDATAVIDTGGLGLADLITNSDGLDQIIPDSPDHVDQAQWFIGMGGVIIPVSDVGIASMASSSANSLSVTYSGKVANVDLSYDLLGGATASGLDEWRAKLTNTIIVTNTSGGERTYDLYHYLNYDVTQVSGASPAGSSETGTLGTLGSAPADGQLVQDDTGAGGLSPISRVTTSLYNIGDTNYDGNTSAGDLSTVLSRLGTAHHGDILSIDTVTAGDFDSDGNTTASDLSTILGQLGTSVPAPDDFEVANDGNTLTRVLANAGLQGTNTATDFGGGDDLASAWQWSVTLQPGDSAQISTVTQVIPEPASLSLLGIGITMLLGRQARRK
jgi:hypothetical protein